MGFNHHAKNEAGDIGRTAPPVEGNWDSEEEAEVEEMGDGEKQAK